MLGPEESFQNANQKMFSKYSAAKLQEGDDKDMIQPKGGAGAFSLNNMVIKKK